MNSYLSKTASVGKDLVAARRFFTSRGVFSAKCKAATRSSHYQRSVTAAPAATRGGIAHSFHRVGQFQSTAVNTPSSFFSTLPDLLKREITEESENPINEMPADLSELKNALSEHWTILDGKAASSSDGALVKMYKKENLPNGSKVTLKFHCQDSLDPEELGFLESAANAASDVVSAHPDDEDHEEASSPVKFDVMISRAGKVLHLSCTSENAEPMIDGVAILPSEESIEDGDLYRGPLLEDLPEDVKDAFDIYLQEECGVNEDVAAFIAMYADYREQIEYINWLKGVKSIVD
mmetsp:Transcript_2934/g.4259  ORF Transcript_2934/g.4259 Transcript_2934/m.4259 type:complete len:293 (-) Transcript_2934:143-1021(-)|eukprot:CAMPEP_0203674870 /NCGR_PEP_ID=MMETSP0090-20130426/17789_1 /ASSEMBLY_ACC=CAM_ASM_001088 /TAXON_ID=426623 /ORGANISM="Chaetoceros affinis, Strain CCMP159" /LENGTH=292 /DNA_ID=CAMNT_0050540865 /DNA_START=92 /DNA_END=970 /DNA_ORIENTATION=+